MTDQQALLLLCAELLFQILDGLNLPSTAPYAADALRDTRLQLKQATEEAKIEIDAEDYAAS